MNDFVEQWIGEGRIIQFIVAMTTIANHVQEDILLEQLLILQNQFGGFDHRLYEETTLSLGCPSNASSPNLWTVTIDMNHRSLNHLGQVRTVARAPASITWSGKAHLIVHHDVK